jgi:hypothetical protein
VLDRIAKLLAFTVLAPWVKVTAVVYSRLEPVIVVTFLPGSGPWVGVRELSTGIEMLV